MKCFYHTDLDGHCAGAIVHKFYKRDSNYTKSMGESCEWLPITYKDAFPFDSIQPNEAIVIVDFSLQKPGAFQRLQQITEGIVWIDHHKTALEMHKDVECRGLRRDGTSGCELAWEFFYPREPMPLVVKMLGRYDVWDFSTYGDDLLALQCGIRLDETNPESDRWVDLFSDDTYLESIVANGRTILKYKRQTNAGYVKQWSFVVEFHNYKAIWCNLGEMNSQLFDSITDEYDLMMPFVFDGKQWTVSIYTKRDDIDCAALAKLYGGGGHRQAAGFQCLQLP